MRLCIGTTPDGQLVQFDTMASRPLLIVGDPGLGKTTLARFLTRWWLAEVTQHAARVFTDQSHQWADTAARIHHVEETAEYPAKPPAGLTVVDGADAVPLEMLSAAMDCSGPTIVTSYGPAALHLAGPGVDCVGLLPPPPVAAPRRSARDAGQGRLDWPGETVPIVPVRCGVVDFPRHRWHTPAALPVTAGM